jgi:hypothetical protein
MKRAPGFFFRLFSSIEWVCHHLGYLLQAAQPLTPGSNYGKASLFLGQMNKVRTLYQPEF